MKKITRSSVLSQIVDTLREAVVTNRFKPGERLVEADLCAALDVSRPSLREALRCLEAERLIQIIPNRGPMIPVITWDDAQQIYHTRKLLEGEAASMAAANATPEDNAAIAAAVADFQAAVDAADAPGKLQATTRFYEAILKAAGNRIIDELLSGLHARISFLRARSMSMSKRDQSSVREMRAIAEAIAEGVPDKARRTAQLHVDAARDAAEIMYSQTDEAAAFQRRPGKARLA